MYVNFSIVVHVYSLQCFNSSLIVPLNVTFHSALKKLQDYRPTTLNYRIIRVKPWGALNAVRICFVLLQQKFGNDKPSQEPASKCQQCGSEFSYFPWNRPHYCGACGKVKTTLIHSLALALTANFNSRPNKRA